MDVRNNIVVTTESQLWLLDWTGVVSRENPNGYVPASYIEQRIDVFKNIAYYQLQQLLDSIWIELSDFINPNISLTQLVEFVSEVKTTGENWATALDKAMNYTFI